ncbi:HAD family hydrolase [Pseudomonas sp. RIT-PI-AD]|uniref:HAD family hydrolase n=1 Tax=Pseudomonas sp. RIT-PI-AD TaxID=3035294 RepID=UPI0021D875D4|nr:HAD family hydrolase [Pseudomonas sp. RIT-PI-AD]
MSVRLITFDLDDTLWDNRPVIEGAETAMRDWLNRHAAALGEVPVEYLWTIRSGLLERQPELRHRLSELRRRTLFLALGEVGYAEREAGELAEGAFQAMLDARHRITFFSDTLPTLERLARHYMLGVITNGNADVRRLGLADHFAFALSAEELGIGKPDPHPFREALRHAGVDAPEAVHVGDHPGDDILGAQQAGLRAIWFNPLGKPWEAAHRADAEIRALAELPELLRAW